MLRFPVVPYVAKLWQLVLFGMRLVRDKAQAIFDWVMNKLVVWLCRYYMGGRYDYC
jgi:hypothetical protein